MSGIHTEEVSPAHAYTRSDSPWIMERHKSAYGKLMHYLSGGGMRTFGRTVRQEEVRRCQRRFCIVFAALAAIWLALLVF
jgi:hypothetical protein